MCTILNPSPGPARTGLLLWFSMIAAAAFQSVAGAHPESVSNMRLTLAPAGLHAVMTLPTRDLTRWFPPGRYPDYVADVVRELQGQADSLLQVRWDDAVAHLSRANVHRGLTGFVIAELDYPVPDGAAVMQVRSTSIGNLPNDHQEFTSLEDDRGGTAGGRILAEETLTAQQDTLSVDLPTVDASASKSAVPTNVTIATASAASQAASGQSPVAPQIATETNRRVRKLLPWLGCALLAAVVAGMWLVQRLKKTATSVPTSQLEGAPR